MLSACAIHTSVWSVGERNGVGIDVDAGRAATGAKTMMQHSTRMDANAQETATTERATEGL